MEVPEALERFKGFISRLEIDGNKSRRLVLNMNEIRQYDKELARLLMADPMGLVPHIEGELNELGIEHVGFVGAFGASGLTPRTVRSEHISRMIALEGIVTGVSLTRPKLRKSVHYCEKRGVFYERDYRDGMMITRLPATNTVYPQRDGEGNELTPEFGLSDYEDFQTVLLQEMPEKSPPGLLPRCVEVVLAGDLVDSAKPGDRVRVVGIYKSFVYGNQTFPARFQTVLIANSVRPLREDQAVSHDASRIALLAASGLRFRAVAPTIYGHDDPKKALLLMLVGGNERQMANGARIRGDINVLLIGDPSTAKSQLLRYAAGLSPLAVVTTGRGASGVGLTAAVVQDKETGEKRLEAGAMVLADRGVCCIDEFDKMTDVDRVAVHEVMEQQTVTIAKAGIYTTLNARCSVLAAANPVFGRYNTQLSARENVRLPESLMTRFDLVFVTLDTSSVEIDSAISKHVLGAHSEEEKAESPISQGLLRAFISQARQLRPVLSSEAAATMASAYAQLRQMKNSKELLVNITPRFLETMIRLATAHAKLRLSETVTEEDAMEAIRLVEGNVQLRVARKSTVKKPCVAAEQQRSLGQELRDEAHAEIRRVLWKWREEFPEEAFCPVERLVAMAGVAQAEVEEVIGVLVEEEVVFCNDGNIYFMD